MSLSRCPPNRQQAKLATCRQLNVNEVHCGDIVPPECRSTVFAQLGFDPSLGRIIAPLHAQLPVKPIDLLRVHDPAFPVQDVINTAITVADVRLIDLLNTFFSKRPHRFGETANDWWMDQSAVRHTQADRHLPVLPNRVDYLALANWPQGFRLITPCSISRSSVRYTRIFFSRLIPSSRSRRRRISIASRAAYFFFHLK